mmetsp:Transcript_17914/g.29959  ORF Transcript_17914/g.29959 Transcript_17914/m.29959 type:complete len:211 (-) Transcript_17914:1568-2200(-)
MQEAFDYYKKAVSLHWDAQALNGCAEREFASRDDEGLPVKSILRKDVLSVNGKKIKIRRIYLKFNFLRLYHPVRGGWVLDGDTPICMICQSFFTFLSRRHHCRLCGNILCANCSDTTVSIKDCPEVGRVRVCSHCFYFQEESTLLHDSTNDLSFGFKNFDLLHHKLSRQSPESTALAHNCCVPCDNNEKEGEDSAATSPKHTVREIFPFL